MDLRLATLTVKLLILPAVLWAQYAVGHRTITFNDPSRTGGFGSGGGPGRQIRTEIYYPATTAGDNTPVAAGSFPVVVIGHGFAMVWSAYENLWQYLVPKGYIVALPRTEGGIFPAPSHQDFALDLRVVNERMQAEGGNPSSPFYQRVSTRSAITGHSMGGGATILAASGYNQVTCIVGFAPAETNPSAKAAAKQVTVPALIFSGAQDGVTPPAQHHIPIFDSLASDCKTFISITGGAHCYFANPNTNCDFGESSSSSGISITRAQQQAITQSLLLEYLNAYLKDSCYHRFVDSVQTKPGITFVQLCSYAPLSITGNITHPSTGQNDGRIDLTVSGGTPSYSFLWSTGATSQNLEDVGAGMYTVTVRDAQGCTATESFMLTSTTGLLVPKSSDSPYPNPFHEQLYVPLSRPGKVRLMSLTGQILYETEGSPPGLNLGAQPLAPGLYFIQSPAGTFKLFKH